VTQIPPTNSKGEEKPPEAVRSQIQCIAAINCLFAEFDAKHFGDDKSAILAHVESLPIAPSVIIDSGGGYHFYWLLEEPFILDTEEKRERAKRLQEAWVTFVGSDNGAKDLARVLRVPGTRNYKPDYAPDFPEVTFVATHIDRLYQLDELEALLSEPLFVQKSQPGANDRGARSSDIEKAAQALDRLAQWRCDDYSAWIEVGMALSELGDAGLTLWDEWSQTSEKYEPGQCDEKWGTFKPGDGLTLGSLFHWADEDDPPVGQHPRRNGTGTIALAMPDEEDEEMLAQSADDAGNAQCVKLLHGEEFAHCEAFGWMHWNGRYWKRDNAEATLKQAIVETLKRRRLVAVHDERESIVNCSKLSARRVKDCQFLFQPLVTANVSDFDNSPDLLNCQNGVVDLRTGDRMQHYPDQYFTYCLPVEYDPKADSTEWVKFLTQAVGGDREVVEYLQMAVGYSITGHTREECLFYIHGPTRSGKGTFTETLLALMGEFLATEVEFMVFTANRDHDANNFDLAPLKPCRFISASESQQYQALNAASVKRLTGGNEVRCSFKHKTHFNYRPQFKIWLTSNFPVQADVEDDAIWSRLRVIEFPNSYLGREDKKFKERMKSPENLRGVLNWAVQGAMLWYQSPGGLHTPKKVTELTKKTRSDQDHVHQWLHECVVTVDGTDAFVPNAPLYQSYEKWCISNGVTPKSKQGLTNSLKLKGYKAGVRKKIAGKTVAGCAGIRLS
jgi:putative DNA primase/helicase